MQPSKSSITDTLSSRTVVCLFCPLRVLMTSAASLNSNVLEIENQRISILLKYFPKIHEMSVFYTLLDRNTLNVLSLSLSNLLSAMPQKQ